MRHIKAQKKQNHLFRISLLLLSVLFFFSGCSDLYRISQPIIILYAFEAEGVLLAEEMEIKQTDTLLGRVVHIGRLSDKDIILAESGVGMTNAAMTVQKMIDTYNPTAIIFSGIAGGIDSTVHIGDIVIPEKWATHDYGYYGADGFLCTKIDYYNAIDDKMTEKIYCKADSILLGKAKRLKNIEFPFDSIGTRIPKIIVGGVGVSGNSFIDQVEKRLWLFSQFNALTTDMETAAVAQVCVVNGVGFIAFRSASDLAGGSGSESASQEIQQFFKVAANNSAQVVMKFIELL